MTKKTKHSCEKCGGQNIKTHQTTYPLKMGEKQLNIGRVSVRECMDCHTMSPTKAGQEKIARGSLMFMSLMSGFK